MLLINPDILRTPMADEGILLLEPVTGKYFELNATSVLIYQCLELGDEISSIVLTIIDKFEIDEQTALADITDLIAELIQNNILIETN